MNAIPHRAVMTNVKNAPRLAMEKPAMFKKASSRDERMVFADNVVCRVVRQGGDTFVMKELELVDDVTDDEIEIGDDTFALDNSRWVEKGLAMHLAPGFVTVKRRRDTYEMVGSHVKLIVLVEGGLPKDYHFECRKDMPLDSLADDMCKILGFLS